MAKKDFSAARNPALRFINTEPVAETIEEEKVASAPEPQVRVIKEKEKPPAAGRERKTRRLNLLLQPSVLADITKIATMRRTSVNDLINGVLKDYVSGEAETLAKYERVFEE